MNSETASKPITEAVPSERDDMSAYLRETHGLDPNWQGVEFEAGHAGSETLPPGLVRVQGGVYPVLTRGPRKGRPNYKQARDERTCFYQHDDFEAWLLTRERREGRCHRCRATPGQVVARVSVRDGTTYQTCPRCNGTGNPPESPQ